MKRRMKKVLVLCMTFLCISQVNAITSNDVTYDNDGTTENLTTTLDNLYSELKKYKTGGSVAANQMLEGATGYSKGVLVTGTIKSKAAQTYTPGTSNQTIAAGQYLSGAQTIAGDANLTAANIAKGKSIFGVSGTYTSDANATAAQILSGKTAYVNGSKVTGTITSKGATTYTPGTSNQTIAAGQYLSGAQTIKGDANLSAGNIAKGKTIFGVSGTYTNDANATSASIVSGYTAYVKGTKVAGSLVDRGQAQYGTIACDGAGCEGSYYAINSLPEGVYRSNGASWAPEARVDANALRSHFGIDASTVRYGRSIAGITGNYVIDMSNGGAHYTTFASNSCGGDWSLNFQVDPGIYIVTNILRAPDGSVNNKNAFMNFSPATCNYQVCSGVETWKISDNWTYDFRTETYLVRINSTFPSGFNMGRMSVCNNNVYKGGYGQSIWSKVNG